MRRPTPLVALAARVAVAVSLLGSGAVAAGVPQMGTPASPGKATADEALDQELKRAAERHGVAPERGVVVGDTEWDIACARAHGAPDNVTVVLIDP